ncbi:DMT family transporter [Brevibacillus choshinensis]|uniref:DMT family transporter n=1 Tax=Brevibacillus choshinensis TaxID=54911 RepID=UPI002E1D5C46|nr:DMT family transporter [Brevibacillus choshinensis]MED4755102.1 DMT family transporter [Brevibacillus choshinensis]MED4784230.1 DMT family transporter [Brevibacillus choshinensis]
MRSQPANLTRSGGSPLFRTDLAVLAVAVVWGSSYVTAKTALAFYPVFLFLFLRFAMTVVLLIPLTWRQLRSASMETWKIGGIFGVFLAVIFLLEMFGVSHTSASNAGFIISLCIVFLPVLDGLWQKRFPEPALLGAVALTVIGTGFLTLRGGYSFSLGDLLILGAAVVRAMFMLLSQRMTAGRRLDSAALTTIQLAVVAIFTGAISVVNYPVESFFPPSGDIWLILLYQAVFCTMFAFYVQLAVIRQTSPTRVGILLGTEPLFSALFAVWIGGEQLTWSAMFGGLLILVATYIGRYIEAARQNNAIREEREKKA